MFDDGKAESGTPQRAGVALVYAVKPLKYAVLFCLGNSDAGVRKGDNGILFIFADRHKDVPAVMVIFYGVIAQVVKHLSDQIVRADDADRETGAVFCGRGLQGNGDPAFVRGRLQDVDRVLRCFHDIHFLCGRMDRALIELGDPDYIINQCDETLAFPINITSKLDHFFLVAESAAHEFGKPVDRCQGCL